MVIVAPLLESRGCSVPLTIRILGAGFNRLDDEPLGRSGAIAAVVFSSSGFVHKAATLALCLWRELSLLLWLRSFPPFPLVTPPSLSTCIVLKLILMVPSSAYCNVVLAVTDAREVTVAYSGIRDRFMHGTGSPY